MGVERSRIGRRRIVQLGTNDELPPKFLPPSLLTSTQLISNEATCLDRACAV